MSTAQGKLTRELSLTAVNTGTCNQDLINNGENTFADDIVASQISDSGIVKNCSFVKLNTTTVDIPSKKLFVRMEELEAGLVDDVFWPIA